MKNLYESEDPDFKNPNDYEMILMAFLVVSTLVFIGLAIFGYKSQ